VPPSSQTAPSPLHRAIAALANRQSLSEQQTTDVFGAVMRGEGTPVQIAALLIGLRVKGETAEEIAGAARALRQAMVRVEAHGAHLVDTCGTGGGTVSTFNISTAAAFVAAGAGASVAKHGNRSFTSQCGSADVLEALGVRIALEAADAARVLREACVTFLFAPNFHPAMKHAGPVRRELAVGSVMNLLGPLANPAGVRRQVVGVAEPDRAPLVAAALARLGTDHALVVHGRIGMDEIAPRGISDVWEVKAGDVTVWELDPERYGLAIVDVAGTMSPVSLRCCSTRAPRSTSPGSLTRTPTGSHGHARWCAPERVAKRWNACAARLVAPDDAHDDALHRDVALVET